MGLFGKQYNNLDFNTVGMDDNNPYFLQWALNDYKGIHLNTLPKCTKFMCNGDIMLHTNKGIIGARFDLIENVQIKDIKINKLYNKSPLSSYACKNYTGQHDGGSKGQLDLEGSMGTDVTGKIYTLYMCFYVFFICCCIVLRIDYVWRRWII